MASLNVKRGDLVEVMVGDEKEKGVRAKILKIDAEKGRVIVEGVNMVKRHTRPRKAQEKGGIVDKPRFIDVSNVMVVCPSCKKAVRVGHALAPDGKKYWRTCKKCGAFIDAKQEKTVKKTAKRKSAKELKEQIAKED